MHIVKFVTLSAVVAIFASLPGCGLMPPKTAPWPWIEPDKSENSQPAYPCGNTDEHCTGAQAQKAFIQANLFCRKVQNFYESTGQHAGNAKAYIAILGTLAGAVFAPLSKGSGTKAWAGLSGGANALQSSIDEAFSSAMEIRRRAAVLAAVDDGTRNYDAKKDYTEKVNAAVSMATHCALVAADADMKALNDVSKPIQSTSQQSGDAAAKTASSTVLTLSVKADTAGKFVMAGGNGVDIVGVETAKAGTEASSPVIVLSAPAQVTVVKQLYAIPAAKVADIKCYLIDDTTKTSLGKQDGSDGIALNEKDTAAGNNIKCTFTSNKQ